MGEGIIIFALWYLAIAFNYYIEKTSTAKEDKHGQTEVKIPEYIMERLSLQNENLTKEELDDILLEKKEDVKEEDGDKVATDIPVDVNADLQATVEVFSDVEPVVEATDDISHREFLHEEIQESPDE